MGGGLGFLIYQLYITISSVFPEGKDCQKYTLTTMVLMQNHLSAFLH